MQRATLFFLFTKQKSSLKKKNKGLGILLSVLSALGIQCGFGLHVNERWVDAKSGHLRKS